MAFRRDENKVVEGPTNRLTGTVGLTTLIRLPRNLVGYLPGAGTIRSLTFE
jgi:hypothetical protein